MKKAIMFLIVLTFIFAMNTVMFAQNAPIDFEAGGYGADWTWTVFENDTNPAVEIIANPDASEPNTSATVAQFTALQTGQPWAGCETMHGSDIGTFNIDATNSTIKIMVWKPVISDVGIKLVKPDGWSLGEIKVANTVINEWEELTFDFTAQFETGYDQLVIFPDFDLAGRTQDNICYFDNITFSEQGSGPAGPEVPAPTPTVLAENVISLFSNAYTNVTVDTWSAEWDQADVTDVQVEGDDVKLYTNLVYAGIEFTSQTIDATVMTNFTMDFWTPDPTAAPAIFKIKLVDFGADGAWGGGDDVEHEITLDATTTPAIATEEWVSLDLPLSEFTALTTTGHLAQLIISGDPNTVYVDNVYFYDNTTGANDDISKAFNLESNYPNPFNPSTTIQFGLNESGYVTLEVYNIKGEKVRTLVDGELTAQLHNVVWNGTDDNAKPVASGVYFYKMKAGKFQETKKMILMK